MNDENFLSIDINFGLDPHVLPRFDLLVAEGKITREFADKVIEARKTAGLPMSPSELKLRPEPLVEGLTWVSEFGGPEIRSDSEKGTIAIDDVEWRYWAHSPHYPSELTHHLLDDAGNHTGWITIRKQSESVYWEHTKVLERKPSLKSGTNVLKTVRTFDSESNIHSAITKAINNEFTTKDYGNYVWYKTDKDRWEVPGWSCTEYSVKKLATPISRDEHTFFYHWEAAPEHLSHFMNTVGISALSGFAASKEEAMSEALEAGVKVIGAAKALVGDLDSFEAGKAAGRSELKLEISRLA